MNVRWRQLAWLSIAELLALSLWFSASAVLPARVRECTYHARQFTPSQRDPDSDAREAASRARDGFDFFKLKVGTTTVERDIEAALKVREAIGPECDLSADANQAWGVAEAIRFAREGAAQIVSVKLLKAGGFTGALRAVHAAETVRLPLHLTGKIAESSIASAALVHPAVAVRDLQYGVGITNHYLRDDLVAAPIRPVAGQVRVPEGPGLGITVNEDRLRSFRTR